WIGQSQGAQVRFYLTGIPGQEDKKHFVDIFTTRLDTIFGATFMVISPELAKKWIDVGWQVTDEVKNYMENSFKGRELERVERAAKDKTGVDTGIKAINPATGEEIPVWLADYVLGSYGTGAIMAVPAHDERDYAFAKKFGLLIRQVIAPHFIEITNPPRLGKKTVHRKTVHIVLRRPSDGKILMLKWKGKVWGERQPHTFIMGGIEEGEDVVDAAKREIKEETGHNQARFIKKLGLELHTEYYAAHKNENRYAEINIVCFELDSIEKDVVADKELETHEPVWVDEEEVINFINVVDGTFIWDLYKSGEGVYTGDGVIIDSGEFSGLESAEAVKKISKKIGAELKTQYKLHDWLISRQRYWGAPIPIIYCEQCGEVPVAEKDLPVVSWYFLRYCDPHNTQEIFNKKKVAAWCPVTFYVGGAEHAVMHLLYARFFTKVLRDLGYVKFSEPFVKLRNQGLILGEDGQKMSKSRGNVINPEM
ncbi:MAG: Leucyl-tRNA synthetase, partial [Parcubacteria group bacterium GW2011_GWB1_43_66]